MPEPLDYKLIGSLMSKAIGILRSRSSIALNWSVCIYQFIADGFRPLYRVEYLADYPGEHIT
jgi:hypothetical protein